VGWPPDDFWVLAESASGELDDHEKGIRFFAAILRVTKPQAQSVAAVLLALALCCKDFCLSFCFSTAARKLNAMRARQLDGSAVRTYGLFKAGSETKRFMVVGSEQTIPNSSKITYFVRVAMTTFLLSRGI
jgi:hypothetical protein